MTTVNIKPLSVNECWQGKRFKTKKYEQYEKDVLSMLVAMKLPEPPFSVYYEFGFSNPLSDIDNPVKPIQDILQKKYGFNDRHVHHMCIVKKVVKKGSEYFKFNINAHATPTRTTP